MVAVPVTALPAAEGFCQISDNEALRARDLVVARPPPDSARVVPLPQMAPDFASLSEF